MENISEPFKGCLQTKNKNAGHSPEQSSLQKFRSNPRIGMTRTKASKPQGLGLRPEIHHQHL